MVGTEVIRLSWTKRLRMVGTVGGFACLMITASCGSSSKASAPTAATLDPVASTNLNCQHALDPWTQFLANSQFQGTMQWISAVGQQSPLINIPEDGARLFIQETVQVGVNQATNDAYSKVREECNTFAQSHPGYDFSALPSAPTSG